MLVGADFGVGAADGLPDAAVIVLSARAFADAGLDILRAAAVDDDEGMDDALA